ARNIRVIPVLVEGARMPKAGELPDPLKALARRQAVEVAQLQFGRDAEALVERVREALNGQSGSLRPWRGTAVAGAAAGSPFLVGWAWVHQGGILAAERTLGAPTGPIGFSDVGNAQPATHVEEATRRQP